MGSVSNRTRGPMINATCGRDHSINQGEKDLDADFGVIAHFRFVLYGVLH